MKTWLVIIGGLLICILLEFVFLFAAYAQIPTCQAALKAQPQGPFPCSVVAAWQDNSTDETGFILQRRLNGGPWVALGGVLAANTTSVVDATLTQSATVDNVYEYQVLASNAAGTSPPSNLAGFTVPKAVSVPKPVTSLTITFQGATGTIKLTGKNTINLKNQDGTMTLTGTSITVVDIQ